MTPSAQPSSDFAPELLEVAGAASAVTRALASDTGEIDQARERSLLAARAALDAGHSLAAMATAEAHGRQQARDQLRGELVRKIRRGAKRLQEATDEHHREIRRATEIGLSTREIASAAGISHGTVRAIINRTDADGNRPNAEDSNPSEHVRSDTTDASASPASQEAGSRQPGDAS